MKKLILLATVISSVTFLAGCGESKETRENTAKIARQLEEQNKRQAEEDARNKQLQEETQKWNQIQRESFNKSLEKSPEESK